MICGDIKPPYVREANGKNTKHLGTRKRPNAKSAAKVVNYLGSAKLILRNLPSGGFDASLAVSEYSLNTEDLKSSCFLTH